MKYACPLFSNGRTALIQSALHSPDLGACPRYPEHTPNTRRNFFRDSQSQKVAQNVEYSAPLRALILVILQEKMETPNEAEYSTF